MTLDKTHREARKIIEDKLRRKLSMFDIVHHKDGNPYNNSYKNLVVLTPEEHVRIHNPAKGKKHKNPQWNKLSEDKIKRIYKLHKEGLNYCETGRELNISNFTARKYILDVRKDE